MSEPQGNAGNPGESAGDASKKLSPLEKIRAAAAAKAVASPAPDAAITPKAEATSDTASAGGESKKLSPLDKIRAAAAAKSKPDAGAATAPKTVSPDAEAAAKEKPSKPAPPKPAKPKATEKASSGGSRRSFITWMGAAWTAFTAGCSAAVLSSVRFLYPNVLQEPPSLFKIGPPDKFEDGNVYEQWKNEFGVWLVKNEGEIYAIRTVCTHLGCTPNWLEGEQKFKCPCHGSGFRKTGINFEGPAPRPLERYAITIADDGQVQIDKSKKFQQELGQWTLENNAFVKV